ncbi:MAG: sulfurtransferase complex subunit TusB [Mesotoga sp.]|jgi:tRNA 2-thiouridine synthesizing protein B|uniref:sulfurtransferase complex subunit TusB n=1 Tax=unclassified Mesotoga TaxID=1184398 RepID=UPI000EF26D0D|nr:MULTISPECIES: sulfurtransferase complex subunit TusB [unclassified Mesotoga]MDI9368984.1 sulfurtransferase complex subunit TusB [Thermotogota bacterium]NLT45599.1 sulfurtransferase complex subunit TusB [Thermotogaceae bacterium]MDD2333214.1 sulfurtransferase complex subunit TusB [Mesotoga sp.]MDD3680963.1 sulfurtransferase complex subunit TusB [Mesotoga sp.]MDD4206332.1 sulfurtransferase complex subunit TusB [Mesotoga sp.]
MYLIVVKNGPNNSADRIKINAAKEGDKVVLIQDGVFWALNELTTKAEVFALKDDVEARGYSASDVSVPLITYEGFIDIVEECEKSIG